MIRIYFSIISFSLSILILVSCAESENPSITGNETSDINNQILQDKQPTTPDQQIDCLTQQINKDRTDANLFHERGKLYYERNYLDQALTDVKVAIRIDSTQSCFYYTLSDIYFTSGNANKYKEALEKCILLEPKHVEALLKLAELHLITRQYKKTIEIVNTVLGIDKHNAKAYFILGTNFKETGDSARAISSFQTAVEKDPDHYHAYVELGLLFYKKKNKLAIDYLNNALNLNPHSIEAHYAKAMFYQENNEIDKAVDTYATILQIDPNYKFAHYNLGFIHSKYLEEYKTAALHFDNAIKCDSTYAEAYYMRGLCMENLGDIAMAREDY
ncbi:MAG: tetratricopeptide repeat protein, partial [Bacteroidota bacterium]